MNLALLIVHGDQALGKLWGVPRRAGGPHVAVDIDEIADVVVVDGVATKFEALGPQPRQQLCYQVPHWPRCRVGSRA